MIELFAMIATAIRRFNAPEEWLMRQDINGRWFIMPMDVDPDNPIFKDLVIIHDDRSYNNIPMMMEETNV